MTLIDCENELDLLKQAMRSLKQVADKCNRSNDFMLEGRVRTAMESTQNIIEEFDRVRIALEKEFE